MNSQMKRGILEMCILHQFTAGDFYGYDLMERMRAYFPDVKDSVFYVILRRLNAEGHTEIYYGEISGGPRRKYYRITEKGRRYLEEAEEEWRRLKRNVEEMGIV